MYSNVVDDMAAFATVYFRVKRMTHNGFDACRYSSYPYEFWMDKDWKLMNKPPYFLAQDHIADLLAHFIRKCPELENKQKYQLAYHGNLIHFFFYLNGFLRNIFS